jgi:DNA polymerase III epsilon subunit-like protein
MSALNDLRETLSRNNWVVLDTETTGLDRPAEICQIGVVDWTGEILLDTLVKPMGSISAGAYRVHGITDLHVKDAPQWPTVRSKLLALIKDRDVVIYNAVFDRKMMHWSDEAWSIDHFEYKEWSRYVCAMEAYAEFWGDKHPYYGSFVWQKLTRAMEQQGLLISGEHSALGDALMTMALCKHVIARVAEQEIRAQLRPDPGPDNSGIPF